MDRSLSAIKISRALVFIGAMTVIGIPAAVAEPQFASAGLESILRDAIFAGLGGALGALIAFPLLKRWGNQNLAKLAMVALVVLGGALGRMVGDSSFIRENSIYQIVEKSFLLQDNIIFRGMTKARVDHASVEKELLSDPNVKVFRILKEHDPARFNRIVDKFVQGSQSGHSRVELINSIRKESIEPILTEKAGSLSDEALIRLAKLTAAQLEAYGAKKPELCVAVLQGKPLGEVRSLLDPKLITEESDLLEEAIKAAKNPKPATLSEAEQLEILQPLMGNLQAQYGDDAFLLDGSAPAGKERQTCLVGAAYFNAIAALPQGTSGKLMRTFMVMAENTSESGRQ